MSRPIKLVLADVDGTLVTPQKQLTDQTVQAVGRLNERGVLFAITSGRPPRGVSMLVGPLEITTPIAAFNGGLLVDPELRTLEQRTIPAEFVSPIIEQLTTSGLDAWLYRGVDWFVLDPRGPHVARESSTVEFEPTTLEGYDDVTTDVVKIVGVSDDAAAMSRALEAVQRRFGHRVSAATSQPYYLDVTHQEANKGSVLRFFSKRYEIPEHQIATIGDMENDVLMFRHSGLSIAMGNGDRAAHEAAGAVTRSNAENGFAYAVDRFILAENPEI
jgi:Cof subfamily protein (haloacid dehalogenase superfamily)